MLVRFDDDKISLSMPELFVLITVPVQSQGLQCCLADQVKRVKRAKRAKRTLAER